MGAGAACSTVCQPVSAAATSSLTRMLSVQPISPHSSHATHAGILQIPAGQVGNWLGSGWVVMRREQCPCAWSATAHPG